MDGKIIQLSKSWAYLHDNPVIIDPTNDVKKPRGGGVIFKNEKLVIP